MNSLARVLIFKISATLIFWALPLILFPGWLIEAVGVPRQETYLFMRLLGWAYLALCVGYYFALRSALEGKRALGLIWVGIISNSGAFSFLAYYGAVGAWASWGVYVQVIAWASVLATFVIALGLYVFGIRGQGAYV